MNWVDDDWWIHQHSTPPMAWERGTEWGSDLNRIWILLYSVIWFWSNDPVSEQIIRKVSKTLDVFAHEIVKKNEIVLPKIGLWLTASVEEVLATQFVFFKFQNIDYTEYIKIVF